MTSPTSAATASTASRVKACSKITSRRHSCRAPSPSRSWLQAIVEASARCRSGTSGAVVRSSSSPDSRLSRRPSMPTRRTRAAASSSARGTPSSSRHTSASAVSCPRTSSPGSAWWAMRRNSWTAGLSSISAGEASAAGTASGGTAMVCSERRRSGTRQVTSRVTVGQVVEDARDGLRARRGRRRRCRGRPAGAVVARPGSGSPTIASTAATTSSAVSRSVTSWKCTSRPASSRRRVAATVAVRVLPLPPSPVRVTSLVSGSVQALHDAVDQVVATVRRGARHRQPRGRAGHRVVAEVGVASGVLEEDRGLDALEGLARLDAELVGHHGARLGVRLQRLLGAVLAVQRRHQLPPVPLAGRMLAGGGAQLLDRLRRPAEPEQQLEPFLGQAVAQLVEPLDDRSRERHVVDTAEHGATPSGQAPARPTRVPPTADGWLSAHEPGLPAAGPRVHRRPRRRRASRSPSGPASRSGPAHSARTRSTSASSASGRRHQPAPQARPRPCRAGPSRRGSARAGRPGRARACRPACEGRRRPRPAPAPAARLARRSA